jgi:radical SAM protein (TIGR01212 family)
MYKTLNEHYKERFGCKVYKLSIDGGFTCPNRDGTIGTKGCIFCSEKGSGEFSEEYSGNITEQLEKAKRRVEAKNKGGKFIAYFQSFTGTYAPIERLEKLYREALNFPDVVGISIATRPDCINSDVLDLLQKLSSETSIYVELGLQTVKEETVSYIRRGYPNEVYLDAVKKLKEIGVNVVTHIIIGLPGEILEDAVNTTKFALSSGTDGVKFHLLYVSRGTDLEKDYNNGLFETLSLEEYAKTLKSCIDILPNDIVVHRITGDGAKKDLIAPLWSGDKKRVLNYLKKTISNP